MEAELQKLTQYIDMVKYFRDAAEVDFCRLRQRSASLAQVRTRHRLSYPALLPNPGNIAGTMCLSTCPGYAC